MKTERILFRDGSFFEVNARVYGHAVRKMESEGLTTSDSQGAVEAQLLGKYRNLINRLCTTQIETLKSVQEMIKTAESRSYPCQDIKTSLNAVCSQICTPRDISNLEIFLNVLKKVEEDLHAGEIEKISFLLKTLERISSAPAGWKTIF